jgi:hypothetical protein
MEFDSRLILQGLTGVAWTTPFHFLGTIFLIIFILTIYLEFFSKITLRYFKTYFRFLSAYAVIVVLVFTLFNPVIKSLNPSIYLPGIKAAIPTESAGEIVKGFKLTQNFNPSQNGLSRIDVFLATFARSNTARLKIQIFEDKQRLVTTKIVDGRETKDNSYLIVTFDPIADSSLHEYSIVLSSEDGRPGDSLTAWMTSSKTSKDIGESDFPSPQAKYLCFKTYITT